MTDMIRLHRTKLQAEEEQYASRRLLSALIDDDGWTDMNRMKPSIALDVDSCCLRVDAAVMKLEMDHKTRRTMGFQLFGSMALLGFGLV